MENSRSPWAIAIWSSSRRAYQTIPAESVRLEWQLLWATYATSTAMARWPASPRSEGSSRATGEQEATPAMHLRPARLTGRQPADISPHSVFTASEHGQSQIGGKAHSPNRQTHGDQPSPDEPRTHFRQEGRDGDR